jgi:hypothetical protein
MDLYSNDLEEVIHAGDMFKEVLNLSDEEFLKYVYIL